MWGAMGGAAMIGLGLALAQPKRRVAVITGDGEMLMGMGALATIGVQQPTNLAVIVFDNGVYGETGIQASHTAERRRSRFGGARPAALRPASRCTMRRASPTSPAGSRRSTETLFARVRIDAAEPPRVLPMRDGVALKQRFRAALGVSGLIFRPDFSPRPAPFWTVRERTSITPALCFCPPSRRAGAQVAQLVEHVTENHGVGGSIPPLGTISCQRRNTSSAQRDARR